MTKRKPRGMSYETWIDREIREAQERGEFDNLPGAGQPIEDLRETHDEYWWVKKLLKRERLEVLPPTLRLRKELEEAIAKIRAAKSEPAVRRVVQAINQRIAATNAKATSGPPTEIAPLDADEIVAQWRALKKDR